jgi:hypothetical protein
LIDAKSWNGLIANGPLSVCGSVFIANAGYA